MLLKFDIGSIFYVESKDTKNGEVALTAEEKKGIKVQKIQNSIKKINY